MTKTLQEQEDEQGYSVDEKTYFHPSAGLNGLIITASSSIAALDNMLGKKITSTRPSAIPAKRKNPTVENNHFQEPARVQRPLQEHDSNIPRQSVHVQQETFSKKSSDQSSLPFAVKAPRILPTGYSSGKYLNTDLRTRARQSSPVVYKHNPQYNQSIQHNHIGQHHHNTAMFNQPAQPTQYIQNNQYNQFTQQNQNQFVQHNQYTGFNSPNPINPLPQHNQQFNQPNQQHTYLSNQGSSSSNDFSIPGRVSTPPPSRIIPPPHVENNWTKKPTDNIQNSTSSDLPNLSNEQLAIYHSVVNLEKSIYLTGTAGTGKSVVLRAIIQGLKQKYGEEKVGVTASTGLAACHIGGVTLHSEMGIGLGKEKAEFYHKQNGRQGKHLPKIVGMKALVIDEISMIHGELFDMLNLYTQLMRKRAGEPFGGMQVVVCGDFFQLPPIEKGRSVVKYAFQANCWNALIRETMTLTEAFRQKDQHFTKILNELKVAKVSKETEEELKRLARPLPSNPYGILPTELYPLKEDINKANAEKLAALSGEPETYTAKDIGYHGLLKNSMASPEITLKVAAQVMLIKNLTPTLVNGSRGIVTGFRPDDTGKMYPVVKFTDGSELFVTLYDFTTEGYGGTSATRTQIPLILAWAISIHKSQGQTIDYLKVDLKKCFDYGQVYVALSRARSMENLQVLNFSTAKVEAHPAVKKFYGII